MFSMISTLGGLLISGLPKLLEFFQNKADKKHELALAEMQMVREKEMMAMGFAAQAKVEEIRADQIAMQTDAEMTKAAYEHDAKVLEKAAGWASTYVATVRPTITYLFVLELIAINLYLTYYLFAHPTLVTTVDDVIKYSDIIFTPDEMSMLGGIIGFWFGSRNWNKK